MLREEGGGGGKERRRQKKKRNLKKKGKIKIYCVCRMPELPTTKLIECSLCKEWFHFTCMNMDENSSVCNTIWHFTKLFGTNLDS